MGCYPISALRIMFYRQKLTGHVKLSPKLVTHHFEDKLLYLLKSLHSPTGRLSNLDFMYQRKTLFDFLL